MTIELAEDDDQAVEALQDQVMLGVLAAIREQVKLARTLGFIVTVETVTREPLAMGNYDARIEVRKAKELYRS